MFIFNFLSTMRSGVMTLICLCGAIFDVILHYFSAREHMHAGGWVGTASKVLIILTSFALIYLIREHYESHKLAKGKAKREKMRRNSHFLIPEYRLIDANMPYIDSSDHFFKLEDDSSFQDDFNRRGFVGIDTVNSVLDSWNKKPENVSAGRFYVPLNAAS